MNSLELKDKQATLIKRCKEIVENCKSEVREMTEDEQKEFDANKEEIKELKAQLEELNEKLRSYEDELPEEEEEEQKSKRNLNKNSNKMEKNFSILKAIRDVAANRSLDEATREIINKGAQEFRNASLNYGGQIQLPSTELRAVTVAAEGEDVVVTDVFNILEPLRAKNVLVQAGAKFMTGLVGNVKVPVMGAGNVTWEGETAAAKDAATAFTNVELTPKRLTAYIDISKQFIAQDSIGAENVIRQDLINAINSKLEATILGDAAGSTTQPAGMFNGQTPTVITDFKGIAKLEADVEAANILGECKYIVAPSAKGDLRAMPKGTKLINPVMENGMIDGTDVLSTSNVPANKLVYGDFTNLAIGSWGAIDLTVDPYTKAADGMIRLVINAYFDAKVLRANAFAFGTTAE